MNARFSRQPTPRRLTVQGRKSVVGDMLPVTCGWNLWASRVKCRQGLAKQQRSPLPCADGEAGARLDGAAKPAKSATFLPTAHQSRCSSSSSAINTEAERLPPTTLANHLPDHLASHLHEALSRPGLARHAVKRASERAIRLIHTTCTCTALSLHCHCTGASPATPAARSRRDMLFPTFCASKQASKQSARICACARMCR